MATGGLSIRVSNKNNRNTPIFDFQPMLNSKDWGNLMPCCLCNVRVKTTGYNFRKKTGLCQLWNRHSNVPKPWIWYMQIMRLQGLKIFQKPCRQFFSTLRISFIIRSLLSQDRKTHGHDDLMLIFRKLYKCLKERSTKPNNMLQFHI